MRNRSLSNLFQCGYPNSSPASMVTMESLWSAGIKGNPETDQRPKHLTGKQLASLNQWRFEAWFKRLSNSLGWFNSGSMSKKEWSDSNKCYLAKVKQLGLQSRHLPRTFVTVIQFPPIPIWHKEEATLVPPHLTCTFFPPKAPFFIHMRILLQPKVLVQSFAFEG